MRFTTEREHLIPAVRLASLLTLRVRDTLVVASEKAGREPVTIADYGSQVIICRALGEHFPADRVVAEERAADYLERVGPPQKAKVEQFLTDMLGAPVSEDQITDWLDHGRETDSARTWVIDPIDGTKGFLGGRRYTIAVGLLVDGEPVFSVMGCPMYPTGDGDATGLLFTTGPDGQPQAVPLQDEAVGLSPLSGSLSGSLSVSVSAITNPALARGVESVESGHADHSALDQIRASLGASKERVVRVDGQDKYAAVACGDAEYYLRLSPDKDRKERIWDHAAGAALVAAAGGTVTDLDGEPLDFSAGATLIHNRGIIASNGAFHDRLVEAVRAAGV